MLHFCMLHVACYMSRVACYEWRNQAMEASEARHTDELAVVHRRLAEAEAEAELLRSTCEADARANVLTTHPPWPPPPLPRVPPLSL